MEKQGNNGFWQSIWGLLLVLFILLGSCITLVDLNGSLEGMIVITFVFIVITSVYLILLLRSMINVSNSKNTMYGRWKVLLRFFQVLLIAVVALLPAMGMDYFVGTDNFINADKSGIGRLLFIFLSIILVILVAYISEKLLKKLDK